jgi:rare lipoprotein A
MQHRGIWKWAAGAAVMALVAIGCGSRTPAPQVGVQHGHEVRGIASWYGPGFHGKRTASGERFNQNELTAAHKTLPFGTIVRVTNLNNGRTVEVRVNDRGPFVRGRVIDLSREAARRVDMIQAGIVPAQVEIVAWGH